MRIAGLTAAEQRLIEHGKSQNNGFDDMIDRELIQEIKEKFHIDFEKEKYISSDDDCDFFKAPRDEIINFSRAEEIIKYAIDRRTEKWGKSVLLDAFSMTLKLSTESLIYILKEEVLDLTFQYWNLVKVDDL